MGSVNALPVVVSKLLSFYELVLILYFDTLCTTCNFYDNSR